MTQCSSSACSAPGMRYYRDTFGCPRGGTPEAEHLPSCRNNQQVAVPARGRHSLTRVSGLVPYRTSPECRSGLPPAPLPVGVGRSDNRSHMPAGIGPCPRMPIRRKDSVAADRLMNPANWRLPAAQ